MFVRVSLLFVSTAIITNTFPVHFTKVNSGKIYSRDQRDLVYVPIIFVNIVISKLFPRTKSLFFYFIEQ